MNNILLAQSELAKISTCRSMKDFRVRLWMLKFPRHSVDAAIIAYTYRIIEK